MRVASHLLKMSSRTILNTENALSVQIRVQTLIQQGCCRMTAVGPFYNVLTQITKAKSPSSRGKVSFTYCITWCYFHIWTNSGARKSGVDPSWESRSSHLKYTNNKFKKFFSSHFIHLMSEISTRYSINKRCSYREAIEMIEAAVQ